MMEIVHKKKKRGDQTKREMQIAYKCIKCSYILYKKPGELPPTFCPNCAINHLKGEIARVDRF
ncbi:MAG: hypothetical protein FJ115_09675 [Deltaproteobacteria bacterium]|nr:hypothetical protein [Deltaproteobacteria bacterium]